MPPPPVPEEAGTEEKAPPLLEEIMEDIFLRLPPGEPECLVRASLASKSWLALLSGTRFRTRYRERHGATPMLGFLTSIAWDADELEDAGPFAPRFVSICTEFSARGDGWGHGDYNAWDCRHGRVLLGESSARKLAVWDPMTGRRWELQEPAVVYGHGRYAAAVLCAVGSGCDHLACHNGPFRVVHLSLHGVAGDDLAVQARSVSSASFSRGGVGVENEWSDPCPGVSVGGDGYIEPRPPVLLDGALYFLLAHDDFDAIDDVLTAEILKYDLSSHSLSLIDAPNAGLKMATASILMAMEDGNLGFAYLKKPTLFVWSRHVGSDGVAAWTPRGVIDLQNHLPIQNPGGDIRLLGSIEGSDVVFVITDLGIYKIDLKSLEHKKISNGEYLVSLIPYMSFVSPREKGATL